MHVIVNEKKECFTEISYELHIPFSYWVLLITTKREYLKQIFLSNKGPNECKSTKRSQWRYVRDTIECNEISTRNGRYFAICV